MGIVVKINWHPHARHAPRADWNIVDLPFGSVEEAIVMIETGRLIVGEVLITREIDLHEYAILSKEVCAFRDDAVSKVQLACGRYFE